MLVALAVKDIVLIDHLKLDLNRGLSVLTGETGAGKSIVLDAFALALGGRGDGRLVRKGTTQGQVSALFEVIPGSEIYQKLNELEELKDGQLLLRRVQMADGRTRAFVNDDPVSVSRLRAIGQALVEIHGQHEARAFTDVTHYRYLLDCFGGLLGQAKLVCDLWNSHNEISARHRELTIDHEKATQSSQYLKHSLDEIDRLAIKPGEPTDLDTRRRAFMISEKLIGDVDEAYQVVAGGSSVIAPIRAILRRIERRSSGEAQELLQPLSDGLGALLENLLTTGDIIGELRSKFEFDPLELDRIEERLFAIKALARKHDVTADQITDLTVSLQDKLKKIAARSDQLDKVGVKLDDITSQFHHAAATLSAGRQEQAKRLSDQIMAELPSLKLADAIFEVEVEPRIEIAAHGYDEVRFRVRTNPGSNPGSLFKVASGGELARFLLAIKVALAENGSSPTLIFDEIDTGAGGAVAQAIGRRLTLLARTVQVIAVTHAPQVAAQADAHFLITKSSSSGGTVTRTQALNPTNRQEEIARMVAGAAISEEARAAAGKLLSEAKTTSYVPV